MTITKNTNRKMHTADYYCAWRFYIPLPPHPQKNKQITTTVSSWSRVNLSLLGLGLRRSTLKVAARCAAPSLFSAAHIKRLCLGSTRILGTNSTGTQRARLRPWLCPSYIGTTVQQQEEEAVSALLLVHI